MIMWLDHKIFGNGYGLRSPYFDNKFYWLVDTKHGRDKGRGAFYTFMHGLGAQLQSFQWLHPNAGEERVLAGYRFRPLHSSRRWLRVDVAWSVQTLPDNIDEAHAYLREMKTKLGELS